MAGHRLNVDALCAALDSERQRRELLWRDVARAAGLSPSTLTRLLRHGRPPDADGLASLLVWLGWDLGPLFEPRPERDVGPRRAVPEDVAV